MMEYFNLTSLLDIFNNTITTDTPVKPLGNFWAVFDQSYLRHSMFWTVTLAFAYTFIFIVGIIGNSVVILVMIFRPQMRTVTNMFIMNLAVADWLVSVVCVPGTLLSNVFTPWILGSFMCKAVAYVQGVSVCASAYSLAAISLDRCRAIYRPMGRPRGISKSQALLTICLIWVMALLITSPWAWIFNISNSDQDGLSYCVETWENEHSGKLYFLVVNLICCYFLPLVLITISNVVIWCHVSHRKVPQDSASTGMIQKMHRRTRHGVRKMLGIVTAAFLISWLPLYILVTRIKFFRVSDSEVNILEILLPFAQWLGSWNSSVNPVLYAFLNHKFREMFKSLLPAWTPFVRVGKRNLIMMRCSAVRRTVCRSTFVGTPSHTTVVVGKSSQVYNGCNSSLGRQNSQPLVIQSFRQEHSHQNRLLVPKPSNSTISCPCLPSREIQDSVKTMVVSTNVTQSRICTEL